MAKEGALVGWKFRNALVLGHVKAVDGDMLHIAPVSKPGADVRGRKREKVLLEEEMNRADVEKGLKQGGHMARTQVKSDSAKAEAMGLSTPHQARARRPKTTRCCRRLAQRRCKLM